MGCDKVILTEIHTFRCSCCKKHIEECDKCEDYPIMCEDYQIASEEWYCYNYGDKHYCNTCWQKELRKEKKGDVK